MTPSRQAFLREFERDLDSISLRDWFVSARKREPVLDEFIDPVTLRGFLQTDERDPRKPQIWRALIRSFHIHPAPPRLFAVGVGPDARIEVTHRWAGTMGFTPDGLPSVGLVPGIRGIHLFAGWNGHGMGWAPGLADLLASHLMGERAPLRAQFRPRPRRSP